VMAKDVLISVAALLEFLMGLFIIKQKGRTITHVASCSLAIAVSLQTAFLLGIELNVDQDRNPRIWHNLYDAATIISSYALFFCALTFPRPYPCIKRVWLPFGVFAVIMSGVALFGGNFSEHKVVNHVHLFTPRLFFAISLAYIFGNLIATMGIFVVKYQQLRNSGRKRLEKRAFKVVIFGLLVTLAIGLTLFVQAVLLHHTQRFYIQSLGSLLGTSIVFYSIIRHKAFDIETVVHKTAAWVVLSSVPLLIAVCTGLWLKSYLAAAPAWEWAVSVGGIGFFIGCYLYVAQPYVDQLFDRRKYDLRQDLDRIINDLAVLKEIRPMAEGILDRICSVLSLEGAVAMTLDPNRDRLRVVASKDFQVSEPIKLSQDVLGGLQAGSILVSEPGEGGASSARALLKEHSFALGLPLVQKGELIGVIALGRKRNLRAFSKREMTFLTQLVSAAKIAFSNSLLLERVRDLDRLKTEFLSNIAHELRGPLFGISTIAEGILARDASGFPEDHRRLIENVRVTAGEMKELVEHLLDLSKIEAGVMTYDFRTMDVGAALRLAVDLAYGTISAKGLKITVEIGNQLPMTRGDKTRIRQCLSNLLSNAIKYTEKGTIHVSCSRKEEGVQVVVEDTGRGMSDEEQNSIFERYRRGKLVGDIEGSGLGLALTKEIIEAHGGTIAVASKLGSGSRFSCYFPVDARAEPQKSSSLAGQDQYLVQRGQISPPAQENPLAADLLKGNGETLLIIDDEDVERDLLRSFLEANGYCVLTAANGIEGLALARAKKPHLVVTDMLMPRLSGPELCHLLKRDPATASIPIIMLTARNNLGDMIFGIQMGADDYIAKPYNLQELSLRIAALFRMLHIRSDLEGAQNRLMEAELIATSTATLVHAIKSPMVLIRIYVKWVRDAMGSIPLEDARKGLLQIDETAESIGRILQGLQGVRIDPPKLDWVDLPELLDSCYDKLKENFPLSRYDILRQYAGECQPVKGDRNQLGMAFTNLLTNALEAMPEGGILSLEVFTDGSSAVRIEIRDSGAGIQEKVKSRLFRPFVTTKDHGTGLGLWTAKQIIETNHGGRLTLESVEGKGTTASVWIPTAFQSNLTAREVVKHG